MAKKTKTESAKSTPVATESAPEFVTVSHIQLTNGYSIVFPNPVTIPNAYSSELESVAAVFGALLGCTFVKTPEEVTEEVATVKDGE